MKKVGENYIKKLQNKCKNRGIKKGSNEERHYKIGNETGVSNMLFKFHDDPTVNESKIVIFPR